MKLIWKNREVFPGGENDTSEAYKSSECYEYVHIFCRDKNKNKGFGANVSFKLRSRKQHINVASECANLDL